MTDEPTEDERKESTFFVTAADDESAVLRDVHDGQVHTLSTNPGVEVHDAVTGTVAPDPPMNVSWQLIEIERRWTIAIERNDESPTAHVKELAAAQEIGSLHREERAGTGEIHVLTVPEEQTEQAVDDVVDDVESTLSRAARLGVNRVEIRWAPGVVSVRYMP